MALRPSSLEKSEHFANESGPKVQNGQKCPEIEDNYQKNNVYLVMMNEIP